MPVSKTYLIIVSLIVLTSFESVFSQKNDSLKNYQVPNVSIIADRSQLLNSIPGSAVIINQEQIRSMRAISGNQILKAVTGVNVVDEEGAGLRMNLGIRGLDPDRSRALLVLEDGVPVALAPYGEPEMYYTPSIDRMRSIELLKGSGSIIHGPQTIGGVLNYITNDPPVNPEADAHLIGGSGGFMNAKAGYGASSGATGFLTELYHKKADRIGLTRYSIYDFITKAKFFISDNSSINAKINVYDEVSNSTYVGITQNMYENGDYFREIAPNDELTIRRYSASLNYQNIISDKMIFSTTAFAYTTSRFWRRQDFSRSPSASNLTGQVYGDTSIQNGAIYMRNSTGNRDRAFDVFGVQPQLMANENFFGMDNEIQIGARFLVEKAYEQRVNGTNYKAISGNLTEDETRSGMALSTFFQDRVFLSDELIITPGIRYEYFDYQRDIHRISSKDTNLTASNTTSEIIPGLGINYNVSEKVTLFAGTHRGFAPPRTKDAITNEGAALDLSAELSWNYELGLRTSISNFLNIEMTAYMLDFSNQIIPVSESSGNLGFGLINGGKTNHTGFEFALMADIGKLIENDNSLSLAFNATYSNAKFSSDRFIGSGDNKVNINGNRLPYAPEFVFSTMLQYKNPLNFGINLNLSYTSEQFTDELNTVNPSNDGTIGKMDAFMLFDVTVFYGITEKSDIFVSIKNITDERYIASRRPQGIKVGIPRFITAGIDFHL
ncbi:TonB-dependent receptor plug domain-containing protein [Candidatus Kapaibacterium sp.]